MECLICGHEISPNNKTGIGCECMSAVKYVISCNIAQDKEKFFELWRAEVAEYQKVFLDVFKNTKFRSEFKKSFYQSIKTAERISKKQLEIIKNMLTEKDYEYYKTAHNNAADAKSEAYKKIFNEMLNNMSREDIEKARKIIRDRKNNK